MIHDTGGNDTINFSGSTSGTVLDLRAGRWSSVNGHDKNIFIYAGHNSHQTQYYVEKVYSSVSYSISGQFIENLTLQETGNVNGTGNSLANAIAGNAGNNTLSGLEGNDIINGLVGQDVIYGDVGNDTLIGGAGNDTFVFDAALGSTNRDRITDYDVPTDTIRLDNAVFSSFGALGTLAAAAFHIGTAAADASDGVFYNSSTGELFYDADGTASGVATQFATLAKGLALTNADFLVI